MKVAAVLHTQGTTRLEPKCQAGTLPYCTQGATTRLMNPSVSAEALISRVFSSLLSFTGRCAIYTGELTEPLKSAPQFISPGEENPTGLPCLLGSFGAEDPYPWFGEMALVSNAPRSAACIALEPTKLLSLAKADFPAFLQIMPSFSQVTCLLTVNTHFPLSQPDRHTLTFLRG